MDRPNPKPSATDVVPINGPAKYSFMLANLRRSQGASWSTFPPTRMDRPNPKPSATDVVPINGPAKYSFMLANLRRSQIPNWPPRADMIIHAAEQEIRRSEEHTSE